MAHQHPSRAAVRSTANGGERTAASGVLVTALAGGAAGRVAPLHGELTLSFLNRLAARYHLGLRDLLAAITETDGRQNVAGMLYPDSEIHLNAQARERVCALSRVPAAVLERALPAWARAEPHAHYPGGPAGRLTRGEEAVAPWGPACPSCCAARTGRRMPARRYLTPGERVCARHQYWLLFLPGTSGLPVPLGRCPEVVDAQRRHVRLLRHCPAGAQAFEVARAVTGSWWDQPWPNEEHLWPARLDATRPVGADPGWWKTAARDLITYPETVAVAQVVASPYWQQQTIAQARGHLPYRLGELPQLLAELAGQLGRPWLAHHLATVTHGPLFTWAHSCVHTRAVAAPAAQKTLWAVHSAHRPRTLSDLLPHAPAADGTQPAAKPARRLRGHSLQAEQAFQTGLAQAHAYHQQHGHLAVPKEDTPADYPLGQWLANTRARHTRMPAHQAAALTALYPWWNAPWSTLWQRTWHQARTHHQTHGPLKPARGFPTTSYSLGEWLYLQCTRYPTLHPEQQRLLTQIGIDAAAAAAARPRRRNLKAGAEEALAHARSYAAEHGSLASVTSATVHGDFRLGQWLANQRNYQRTGHRPLPAGRAQALTAIDPWWCPPWHLTWQRSYHRARNAADGHRLQAENGFNALDDSGAADWLWRQCATYGELHPEQRQLLVGIGITTEVARTTLEHARTAPKRPTATPVADVKDKAGRARKAAGPAAVPGRRRTRRATEPKRPRDPHSRLGHRPDLRPGFETALAHARAWHAAHGHLAAPRDTLHDGYPLGWWLFSQRNRAKDRARRGLPPSPHLTELAAIDSWWNPPWDLHWQRNYYRTRDHIKAGRPFDPAARIPAPSTVLGTWITRACLQYDQLHPGQQHLLNAIGITAQTAGHWRPSPRPRPHAEALRHARTWAAEHGHLCPPIKTVHDGFPLGTWLDSQRQLAKKRTSPSPTQQMLATIDPWWNPPWPILWQRAYHHAHTHPRHPATRHWLHNQQRSLPLLHPRQQQLLTTTGLVSI
ncbi:Helicase associated domain protein [Streptomyces sp. NBC_00582]|uniref:Helicase associated domain protein n=1 Tax=Streptomyces sp. NBC_00582 TaxID=2975783 RepID=UPI002E80C749|nr:Helicase associated domain protein [Streptomyces sp. NBC_00582]WUB58953.1 Helicase associated domain protein [Streptomyces sp. NBC_00582]WUB67774.1 Helicase associated domain protein [Streptomyces sp. NBC_00582]